MRWASRASRAISRPEHGGVAALPAVGHDDHHGAAGQPAPAPPVVEGLERVADAACRPTSPGSRPSPRRRATRRVVYVPAGGSAGAAAWRTRTPRPAAPGPRRAAGTGRPGRTASIDPDTSAIRTTRRWRLGAGGAPAGPGRRPSGGQPAATGRQVDRLDPGRRAGCRRLGAAAGRRRSVVHQRAAAAPARRACTRRTVVVRRRSSVLAADVLGTPSSSRACCREARRLATSDGAERSDRCGRRARSRRGTAGGGSAGRPGCGSTSGDVDDAAEDLVEDAVERRDLRRGRRAA